MNLNMRIYKLLVGILLSFFALGTTTTVAQTGDQILDGIGETGLISRYTFDGDLKDWSRNNLHGSIVYKHIIYLNVRIGGFHALYHLSPQS